MEQVIKGSVKDLYIIKKPEENVPGVGRFKFSDRYSVFDWGEMPDHIPNKGASLCIVGAYFFEKLEEQNIKTHYRGVVINNRTVPLKQANMPPEEMEVNLVRVIKPLNKGDEYDYSLYKNSRGNFLIPLEIIYRNALPPGSSVFKRIKEERIKPQDLGLEKMPEPGEVLDKPIFDLSTKLENTDRYVTWEEAMEMTGINSEELEEMRKILFRINSIITQEVKKLALFNEDGKIELAFDKSRKFVVVDVFGTPDECRFSYNGFPVSKETLRIYYRKTEWYKEVNEAKKKDPIRWKEFVKTKPPSLPSALLKCFENLYTSFANDLTGEKWFPDSPTFPEAVKELKERFEG